MMENMQRVYIVMQLNHVYIIYLPVHESFMHGTLHIAIFFIIKVIYKTKGNEGRVHDLYLSLCYISDL